MPEPMSRVLPVKVTDLAISHEGRELLNVGEFTLNHGDFVCIVGPNGAGKSLLLKAMAGLHPVGGGRVQWAGRAPSRPAYGKLGMLLQSPVLLRRSVRANIDFALKAQGELARAARKAAVRKALQLANMEHLADSSARLLSGGERQRLALVRALACGPELLLLDEPTASMDPASTAWLESTLVTAHRQGLSVAMVSHDLNQARRLANRMVLLHRSTIVEDRGKEHFFDMPHSPEARAFVGGELFF